MAGLIRRICNIGLIFLLGSTTALKAQSAADQLRPLIETSAQRLSLAKEVALAKWDSNANVEDPKREAQVIESAAKAGESSGLSRQSTEDFFKAQIEANKIIQYSLLADWRRAGKAPDHSSIDLVKTIRPELDRIQTTLLSELAATQKLRMGASCKNEVAKAVGEYVVVHPQNATPLFTIALDRAVAGSCNF